MRAALVHEANGTPAWAEFAEPSAGPGEILVRVAASALSPLARMRASGRHYSVVGTFPFVAGVDGVGTTEDGTRVYFLLPRAPHGAMAERTVVPASHAIPLPDGIDDVTAAVIANPGMSSWAALRERAQLAAGETVLVNGATGASGQLAVRIARHLGAARVIATGRNEAVLDALGADETIPLGLDEGALASRFEAAFAEGVDVVLDYLWGASASLLLAAGAKAGVARGKPIRFVQIGTSSGAEIPLPGALLRSSTIVLTGSGLGSVPMSRLLASIGGVFGAAGACGLALEATRVPFAEIGTAWSRNDGRIVFVRD